MTGSPHRRGATSKALAIAMVFGIAGGALAAWTLMSNFAGGKRPIGPPSMERPDGPRRGPVGPGAADESGPDSGAPRAERSAPAEPASFPVIKGDADVEALLSDLRNSVSVAAGSNQDLASMGATAQSKLAECFALAMTPYLYGDQERIESTAAALGAPPREPPADGAEPARRPSPIMALLKHASIDASRAKVLPWRPEGRMDAMANAGEGEGPREVMALRMAGLYTDIDDFEKKKLPAVEVRAPLLPSGADPDAPPTIIGAVMVWNQATQTWQPAQINFMSDDSSALRAMMSRAMGR